MTVQNEVVVHYADGYAKALVGGVQSKSLPMMTQTVILYAQWSWSLLPWELEKCLRLLQLQRSRKSALMMLL